MRSLSHVFESLAKSQLVYTCCAGDALTARVEPNIGLRVTGAGHSERKEVFGGRLAPAGPRHGLEEDFRRVRDAYTTLSTHSLLSEYSYI